MSTKGFTGNKTTGTETASAHNRPRSDEHCRHCGLPLRERSAFETEDYLHQELRCPGCGRDGCLSQPRGPGVPMRRGLVFSGPYGGYR